MSSYTDLFNFIYFIIASYARETDFGWSYENENVLLNLMSAEVNFKYKLI